MTIVDVHTSGHAPFQILQKMADKLKPRAVIPVHTEHASDYSRYFKNVVRLKDGQKFVV
jgi:ribonuclease J